MPKNAGVFWFSKLYKKIVENRKGNGMNIFIEVRTMNATIIAEPLS